MVVFQHIADVAIFGTRVLHGISRRIFYFFIIQGQVPKSGPPPKAPRSLLWGHPKVSRNGSRMDDMRNRDRGNDRTGPRNIFRPLPGPKNLKIQSKMYKNPVWGPSLGLCSAFCTLLSALVAEADLP